MRRQKSIDRVLERNYKHYENVMKPAHGTGAVTAPKPPFMSTAEWASMKNDGQKRYAKRREFDEAGCAKVLERKGIKIYNNRDIVIPKNFRGHIGSKVWGRIDFLRRECKYRLLDEREFTERKETVIKVLNPIFLNLN